MKKLLAVATLTIALMGVTVNAGDIEQPPAPCTPTLGQACTQSMDTDTEPASDVPVEILIPVIEAVLGLAF